MENIIMNKPTPNPNETQFRLNEKQLEKIFIDIGYRFTDTNILIIALTRKSAFTEETDRILNSYERLEYLGDSVIKLAISDYLYDKYPMNTEGQLTFKRNKFESNKFLSKISNNLNLCGYLNADESESQMIFNYKLQADLFESIIGAIFIDSNKNFPLTKGIIEKHLFSSSDLEEEKNIKRMKDVYNHDLFERNNKNNFNEKNNNRNSEKQNFKIEHKEKEKYKNLKNDEQEKLINFINYKEDYLSDEISENKKENLMIIDEMDVDSKFSNNPKLSDNNKVKDSDYNEMIMNIGKFIEEPNRKDYIDIYHNDNKFQNKKEFHLKNSKYNRKESKSKKNKKTNKQENFLKNVYSNENIIIENEKINKNKIIKIENIENKQIINIIKYNQLDQINFINPIVDNFLNHLILFKIEENNINNNNQNNLKVILVEFLFEFVFYKKIMDENNSYDLKKNIKLVLKYLKLKEVKTQENLYYLLQYYFKMKKYEKFKSIIEENTEIIKEQKFFKEISLIYADFQYKKKNYLEALKILYDLKSIIQKSENMDENDINYINFSMEEILEIIKIELKITKILFDLNDECGYFTHFGKILNLIYFFEENLNKNPNLKILERKFYLIKRKYIKLSLVYNMKNNLNEIQINSDFIKEILEIDAKYLQFTKYCDKDLLLVQKMFFDLIVKIKSV